MDTEFKKKVIEALELISITANQAWWAHHSDHCGANFRPDTCPPCYAYLQCKRNERLVALFKELLPAVG